ncbi:MAG TPA: nuclear transport factor 2 family protein [Paracoccaceae bacterium]|nr:nuclear transport factor 2 family protein [Paracoccaceae bacterium]HMO73109.1 nuclear transport factor 2 family protein [Paracoccaceae bacterium]
MTLEEIARELVAGCREGRERANLDRLYAAEAVSVEGADMGGQGAATEGLAGIHGKHDWWESTHITHGVEVEGPFTHAPDRFAVIFGMDVENRETAQRMKMREVAVYTVADGRIVREEFYYGA